MTKRKKGGSASRAFLIVISVLLVASMILSIVVSVFAN
jgi:hypothetical protein